MMGEFWKHLKKYVPALVDIGKGAAGLSTDLVTDYLIFLKKWTFRFALIAAFLAALAILSGALGIGFQFFLTIFVVWIGVAGTMLAAMGCLLLWALQQAGDLFPSARRTAQTIAVVAFWGLLLPIVCLQPGVRRNPSTAVSLIVILAFLAIGSFAGILRLPSQLVKRIVTAQLTIMLLLTVLAIKFPNTVNIIRWLPGRFDAWMGQAIAIEEKFFDDPDDIVFVTAAGDPALYGSKQPDGWHLALEPGSHKRGFRFEPIAGESNRTEIYSQVKIRRETRLAAEKAARDAAEEQERERKATDVANRLKSEAEALAEKRTHEAEALSEKQRLEAEQIALAEKQRMIEAAERAEAERLTEQELQRNEVKYRAEHIDDAALQQRAATHDVAIAVLGREGEWDEAISDALLSSLTSKELNSSDKVLKDQCISDGTFERLWQGDAEVFQRLFAAVAPDAVVLGKCQLDLKPPTNNRIIHAKLSVELRVLALTDGHTIDRSEFAGEGMAFSNEKAEERAREELTEKLRSWKYPAPPAPK